MALQPNQKCLTLERKLIDQLRERNEARGLPTLWKDGSKMSKPALIAEEHMWEMMLPDGLENSVRRYVISLVKSTIAVIKKNVKRIGVTITAILKSEIIGDALEFLRTTWEYGKHLPALEDVRPSSEKKDLVVVRRFSHPRRQDRLIHRRLRLSNSTVLSKLLFHSEDIHMSFWLRSSGLGD